MISVSSITRALSSADNIIFILVPIFSLPYFPQVPQVFC